MNNYEYNNYYPNNDFATLKTYNTDFYNRQKNSFLRLAKSPGTLITPNKFIQPNNLLYLQKQIPEPYSNMNENISGDYTLDNNLMITNKDNKNTYLNLNVNPSF